jgi:proteasome accessory factor B
MVAEEPSKVIRQFSLIHAMLASRFGLTVDEILNTVDGYRDTFDPYSEKSLAAVTKSFERDKKDVRDLGIVIQTRSPADASNDNHGVRYLIDPATYVLPADVEFSRGEIALLQVAARAWQQGSMNKEALRALNKLRSLGIEPDSSLTGVRPRISGWNGAVDGFSEILSEAAVAEFDYLKPGDITPATRHAAPLALIDWNGLWYLLAWDLDRNAERTFLISRVTTVPRMVPGLRHERSTEDFASRLTAELEELAAENIARVRAVADSDADFRLTAKYGAADAHGEICIPTADLDLLADELVEFGWDVEIIAPEHLRTLIHKRFDVLRVTHEGTS